MALLEVKTRYATYAEASEDEKKEFEIAYRPYRNQRKHPIWKLSEKGCQLYIEKICAEEKRSKTFVEEMICRSIFVR